MVDEMVVAQAQWLPQYADAIAGAKKRLAHATVKTRDWKGVASRDIRPIEEIRAERQSRLGGQPAAGERHGSQARRRHARALQERVSRGTREDARGVQEAHGERHA